MELFFNHIVFMFFYLSYIYQPFYICPSGDFHFQHINISVCISLCLFNNSLHVCPSICLSIQIFFQQAVYLSVRIILVCQSYLCLSINLSLCPSIVCTSVNPYFCVSLHSSICLSVN